MCITVGKGEKGKQMDLSSVEAFVGVAELKSFTEAARVMGITSSGVSRAVSRLEANTGVLLLNRTTRSVGLTAAGAVFFERCRNVIAELREAEAALLESTNEPSGKLRITAPVSYGRSVLIPMVHQFHRRYPQVIVEMSFSDAMTDLVDDGFDLAMRVGGRIPLKLESRRIATTSWIACASPEYLSERGAPGTPDDLVNHDCVTYSSPVVRRSHDWRFSRDGRSWTVKTDNFARCMVDHCDALVDVALMSGGIVYLHDYAVRRYLDSGKLVRVLERFTTPSRSVHAIYHASRNISPKISAFVGCLFERTHW